MRNKGQLTLALLASVVSVFAISLSVSIASPIDDCARWADEQTAKGPRLKASGQDYRDFAILLQRNGAYSLPLTETASASSAATTISEGEHIIREGNPCLKYQLTSVYDYSTAHYQRLHLTNRKSREDIVTHIVLANAILSKDLAKQFLIISSAESLKKRHWDWNFSWQEDLSDSERHRLLTDAIVTQSPSIIDYLKAQLNIIDDAIVLLRDKICEHHAIVYRGLALYPATLSEYQEEQSITLSSLVSASRAKHTASKFDGGVMMVIRDNACQGADIAFASTNQTEREYLFPRGTTFKVVSRAKDSELHPDDLDKNDNHFTIELKTQ